MATLSRLTTGRAVHLRMHPRPQNIGESREILRLISKFGEVEYFKNLKYDALTAPQTALVIFKDGEAAAACIKRCPIRFRLGPAPPEEQTEPAEQEAPIRRPTALRPSPQPSPSQSKGPTGAPFGMSQSRTLSTAARNLPDPPRQEAAMPFIGDIKAQRPPETSRLFQLSANEARVRFRDRIDESRYHNPFPIWRKSAIQADLEKSVPLPGLSCWNWKVDPLLWDDVREMKAADREGPNRRKSLRELYEEGLHQG